MIWWLASYPKSGNTWLRMFLSAYRNGGRVDINNPHEVLVDDVQPYFHQVVAPCPLDKLSDEQQMLLRPAALLHLAKVHNPAKPLFVKTHFCNGRIAGVDTIPPLVTHGAVYIVRDPRDVAVSFAAHRDCEIDDIIECMGRRDHMLRRPPLWQHLASWSDHVMSWVHAKGINVIVVRYEDLLTEPKDTFRGILTFLHHEIDEVLLDRAIAATRFQELQAQEDRDGFREKAKSKRFFSRGTAGGWIDALSDKQALQIENDHGDAMREFSYL